MKLIFHFAEGKTLEFSSDKDQVIIGRGSFCDIVLPYEGFSRKHAQIELLNGEVFVTDLGSTNGVFIDGQRILASERTQMQTFFNLQIGPAQQVEIIDDKNVDQGSYSHSKDATGPGFNFRDVNENTKTTRMDSKQVRNLGEVKKLSKVSSRGVATKAPSQTKTPIILVSFLLAVGTIYYFNTEKTEEVSTETQTQTATGPSIPLSETNFISAAMMESLVKNKSCESDNKRWCLDAGILSSRQEGVVVEGKSLIVYMNMTSFLAEKFENTFNSQSEQTKLEVLLLRRVFSSTLIRSLGRQTTFDNVQVAGGKVENGELNISLAIKIRRDVDLKNFDKFSMIALFDQVINQGKVKEISKLSSLYEKLPIN